MIDYANILDKKKVIVKGPAGSGKSSFLLDLYTHMVENQRIHSSNILILLLNRSQSLEWRKKTVINNSERIWRTSYYGFIQDEIMLYYPIVDKNCPEITKHRIKPAFLTFETAQFLINLIIRDKRERFGILSNIVSNNEKIAIDIASTLVKAAASEIPYERIGQRLFNALELKDEQKKILYAQIDEIIKQYKSKCIELGVFDFSMAVDIYNRCLLNDNTYFTQLTKRIRHIIVDDIEENVPAVIDFVDTLLPYLDTCILGYNEQGGYGDVFGGNHDYMKSKLLKQFKIFEAGSSKTCNTYLYEFSEMLYDNICKQQCNTYSKTIDFERIEPVDLRSDMLEKAAQKTCELLHMGYLPNDIAIISSHADPVAEYVIGRILEKEKYILKNLTRKSRVIDNPFSQALITIACLCHPQFNIVPTHDDVKTTIQFLLQIDPVRSSILSNLICKQKPFAKFPDVNCPELIQRVGYYNAEKYKYISEWIQLYKDVTPVPIDEFFQKVFMEILLSVTANENDLLAAKNLIDSSTNFRAIVSGFENINADKSFIEMIRGGVKAAETIFELEEKIEGNSVLISTPVAYLANSLCCKAMIFLDISSNNWTPRSIGEISNYHVLSKTWDVNQIYTEQLENINQMNNLGIIMRLLLKRCSGKVITFESNLSAGGFENNGILSDLISDMLSTAKDL